MPDKAGRSAAAALLVTLVAPPAVAGGLGQQWVARHPASAIAIFVAYEVIVAIGGFFAVIARDVSSRWEQPRRDRLDLFLQRKVSRFELQYRRSVLARLLFVDLKGLATRGPFTPELDEIFVDVAVMPRPPQQIGVGPLPQAGENFMKRCALGDFLFRERPSVLAVVGGPGTGKTTLLRHTARQICSRKDRHRGSGRDRPVLLYLRDHAAAIIADAAVPLAALLRKTLGELSSDEPPGWFEQKLNEGRCIVLLDGLDEVARQDDRAKVATWTENQINQYPANDFVISSRPQGYRAAPVEGAEIVQVCGFTSDQVDRFVRGWYFAIERRSTGVGGAEVQALAEQGADDLLRRLAGAPALYDLTANPLLLTMIANVHRYRGALPGSRADLYSEICQVMLWRRQEAKKLPVELGGDKKEAILQHLAYAMMGRGMTDMSRNDALPEIEMPIRRFTTNLTPDDFLADATTNGLLIERETEQFAFAHKSFQEYLAAAYIRERGMVEVLSGAVNDDWWRETTLLSAARSDADPIIRACLEANTIPALALAFDCADQGSAFDPGLRARLDALLRSGSAPDAAPEHRRLIAGILLSRHLRQRLQVTDGAQVCAQPVTNQIYRLFLADTMNPPPDANPEDLRDTSGLTVGIRGSDAAAFVQWANSVSGGQPACRLASSSEVGELAVRRGDGFIPGTSRQVSVWVQPDESAEDQSPALWHPPGVPRVREIDSATLRAAITEDLARAASTHITLLVLRARILARDLDRAVDLASALDLAENLDLAQSVTADLAGARALALDLARALDPVRARALDSALDRILDRALHRALDLDRALALDHILSRERFQLTKLDADRRLTDADVDQACGSVMGRVLAKAITTAPHRLHGSDNWADLFPVAFSQAAGIRNGTRFSANPDDLIRLLRDAVRMLGGLFQPPAHLAAQSWPMSVAEHLTEDASPVFSRYEPPTAERATAIRVAALCLAGEADGKGREDLGDTFRQLAAGITLLEQRRSGRVSATEVILLAV